MAEHDVHVVLGEQHGDAASAVASRRSAPSARRARPAPCRRSARPSAAAGALASAMASSSALEVAIGEDGGGPVRLLRHADLRQQAVGLGRAQMRRRAPQTASLAGGARAAPSARSRAPSSSRRSAVTWKVRPTPSRQMRRGRQPAMSGRRARRAPASGRSWPPSMLKQVDLPAPFGPISASISPGCDGERDAGDRLHAAERLAQVRRRRERHATRLAPAPLRRAGEAPGKTSTSSDDRGAEHQRATGRSRAAACRAARVGERADERPGERLHAAEQHHESASTDLRDAEIGREHAALGDRRTGRRPGPPPRRPARRRQPQRARASMPIASARSRQSRAARSA